MIANVLMG